MPRSPASRSPSPAFTLAEARAEGLSATTVRSRAWNAPHRGVRVLAGREDDHERLAALIRALPDGAFCCGPTAAVLLGLPAPRRIASSALRTPFIAVSRGQTRVRRQGMIARRLDVAAGEIVDIGGIRCSSPARTWAELAESLSVAELTAITDRLLWRRHPLVSREDLEQVHRRLLGGRGSPVRRRSLDLASDRSESPRESELRVLLVMAGLPTPECNVEIFAGRRFVARVDMLYRAARLIIEYDGDYHRDPHQWSRDQVRRAELESLGYRVTVVTARDFDDTEALLARIRRLLSRIPRE